MGQWTMSFVVDLLLMRWRLRNSAPAAAAAVVAGKELR